MGNCTRRHFTPGTSLDYSVKVEEAQTGSTPVYRHPLTKEKLMQSPADDLKVLRDAFLHSLRKYPTRDFLGTRLVSHNNQYTYKTYLEIFELAKFIGSGIINKQLLFETEPCEITNFKLKVIGIFSKNREEWIVLDIACALFGFTMVPFYDTLGPTSIPYIFQQTELTSIFCSAQSIETLMKTTDLGNLKNIISFDGNIPIEIQEKIASRGIKFYQFYEILACGQKKLVDWEKIEIEPERPFTFSYTSGTTGTPKGVLLTNTNMVSLIGIGVFSDGKLSETDVYLSYLPLPHIYERAVVWMFIYASGCIGFYSGDILKIMDDLKAVRPTVFASVPRLYNRIYNVIMDNINALTGIKKVVTEKAINTKIQNFRNYCIYKHVVYDKMIFNKARDIFGGRIRYMVTCSAPISDNVLTFLKIAICCPILELYGQTESSGGSFISKSADVVSGHVGGPTVNTEFKLVDVPELKYFATDPNPRGEICFRGPGVFVGYYKDKQKTRETIDKDGWLHSGDIGEIQQNGSVKIIDRVKNIFKLAQGEYVATEKIENCYMRAKGVSEIFIYGNSLSHYLVAIIVPIQKYIEEFAKQHNLHGTFREYCQKPEVIQLMQANLIAQAKYDQLAGFEQPKAIYLEPESFMNFGILTAAQKIKRNEAKQYFAQIIEKLYNMPIIEMAKKK